MNYFNPEKSFKMSSILVEFTSRVIQADIQARSPSGPNQHRISLWSVF